MTMLAHRHAGFSFAVMPLSGLRSYGMRREDLARRRAPDGRNMGFETARLMYDTFDKQVDALLSSFEAARVLDAGCASGFRAAQLAQHVRRGRVTGLDFPRAADEVAARIQALRDEGAATFDFIAGDLAAPDFDLPCEAFDMVHAKSVLTFLKEKELAPAMCALTRAIAPGGYICALLPAETLWWSDRLIYGPEDQGDCVQDEDGRWLHRFSTINHLLRENGLGVTQVLVNPVPPGAAGQSAYGFTARKPHSACRNG